MAEVTDSGSSAEKPGRAPKRRLRTPATETIRERNERLNSKLDTKNKKQEAKSSGALATFWSGFTLPLRKLGRGIKWLGKFRVFRFIGRILYPRYLRNSWIELRQVTWPNRKKSWQLTYAVIVFSVLFGIIVFFVDLVLDKIFKELILK